MAGFGGIGEGMSLQLAKDGRRILWLAHESAPKNFTGVDVSDPRNPKLVVQTELAHRQMRSNSLEVCGDIMAVAYQTAKQGAKARRRRAVRHLQARVAALDLALRLLGPHSRGVHQVWFIDGETVHFSGGAADFTPRNRQGRPVLSRHRRAQSCEAGEICRWWMPGIREGDDAPPPPRHPKFDGGFRTHNTNVYPERPDRAYLGYIDGGIFIVDISDKARPKAVGHWNPHPPFPGFTHTAMPLFERDLLVVSDEAMRDKAADWPKLVWILDMRREDNLVPVSTLPLPIEEFRNAGGRFGAHNHARKPAGSAFRSSQPRFRHLFQRRHPRARHRRPAAAKGSRLFRARPAQALAHRRGADQRLLCRRERAGLSPSTASPAASTSSR